MSNARAYKEYTVRRRRMGGSTLVDADRAARHLDHLSQRMSLSAIGRVLHTSHNYVSAVIRGEVKNISPEREREILSIPSSYWPEDVSQVATLGPSRRVQALHALGYTWALLEREMDGYSLGAIKRLALHPPAFMDADHAASVRETYERLAMHIPTSDNHYDESGYQRARNNAKRRGWSPPLSWDDIDDPRERPMGVYREPITSTEFNAERTAKRLADLEHAAEHGHTLMRVLSDLEIGEEGLWKWCKRNGRDDLWRLFKGRQDERDGRGSDAA